MLIPCREKKHEMNTTNNPGQTRSVAPQTVNRASAHTRFISYVCTRFLLDYSRPKDGDMDTGKWVHVSTNKNPGTNRRYIDGDLIPYTGTPGAWQTIVNDCIASGAIQRKQTVSKNGHTSFYYAPGNIDPLEYFDPEIVKPEREPLNELHTYMANCLPTFRPSNESAHAFLLYLQRTNPERHKKYLTAFEFMFGAPELFLKVDSFAKRVHTPYSGLETFFRPHLYFDYDKPTVSIDLKTSQPLILAEMLFKKIGHNEFTQWVRNSIDIYEMFRERAHLATRNDGKKLFFELIFAPPSKRLERMFKGATWVQWLNQVKREKWTHHKDQRHTEKGYNVIAYYLQYTESHIMTQVWQKLKDKEIYFLSVHDEIIVPKKDKATAIKIFDDVLKTGILPMGHAQIKVNKPTAPLPIESIWSAAIDPNIDAHNLQRIKKLVNGKYDPEHTPKEWHEIERIIYQARAENNK